VGMQLGLASYQAVICTDVSHINTDECGAAERYIGAKLLPVPAPLGRMDPKDILRHLHALGVEHHSQPRIVSVTQATELGTVYHPDMIREIARLCRANGLYLHMDGARLSNAAVALDEDLAGVSTRLGVDILSLGATKNGLMFGEAVVITRPELAKVLPFVRKQGMQLASKMRFISAQFHGMFSTDLWARNARAANSMAQLLAQELRRNENVEIVYPVEANAVFARLPAKAIGPAQREVFFYTWDEADRVVRLMCSFDTTEEDIRRLVSAIGRAVA